MNLQLNNQNNIMPLMMAFTQPTPILDETTNDFFKYDDEKQIAYSTMGLLDGLFSDKVGTRSLRGGSFCGIAVQSGVKNNGQAKIDKPKNEIDDQKEKK